MSTNQQTPKRTTVGKARKARKLAPRVAQRIRSIHGASAAIARLAGFSRGYVWDVVHLRKPPSAKLLSAISEYLDKTGGLMQIDAMRLELGETQPAA